MTDQSTIEGIVFMTDAKRFIEAAKLLGLELKIDHGMFEAFHNGKSLGTMSASAWLDHLRNALIKSNRS